MRLYILSDSKSQKTRCTSVTDSSTLQFYGENYKCFQHQATDDSQLNMKGKTSGSLAKFLAVSRVYWLGRRRNHRVKGERIGFFLTLGTMGLTSVGKTNE